MRYLIYFLIFILSVSFSFGESITSLPYKIDKSGYYVLDTSATLNSSYAIMINANNVVLEGNQNVIKGLGEFGIIANGKNITISNITLIGWKNGILMTSNDTILNNVNVIKNESLLKIKINDPYMGVLSIVSNPSGDLYINNRYVKTTPCEVKLKPGIYNIIIYNQSENKAYSTDIKIDAGIKYILQPKLLSIKSNDKTTFNGIFKEPISIGILISKNRYYIKENGNIVLKIKNPKVNDKKLIVEEYHTLPKNIFIGVQGYNIEGGSAIKSFSVFPSDDEFIDKLQFSFNDTGRYIFHSKVIYYPERNKSLYREITLVEVVNVTKPTYENLDRDNENKSLLFILEVLILILVTFAILLHFMKKINRI